MNDDLQLLFDSTGDEGPRAGFRSELRDVLLEEIEQLSDATPADAVSGGGDDDTIDPVDEIEVLFDDHLSGDGARIRDPRAWVLAIAAAAIGIALIAALIIDRGDDFGLDTVDVPEDVPEESPETSVVVPPAEVGGPVSLILARGSLPPGEYQTTTVGTPLTFSTESDLAVVASRPGLLQFGVLGSQNFTDRTLRLQRISALPAPGDLAQTSANFDWPAQDIDGWLESLDEGVLLEGPTTTSVGRREATRFEIQVSAFGCGLPQGCPRDFESSENTDLDLFSEGVRHRVWLVDQGEEDVLAISAAIGAEEDQGWFDQSETLLASFEFGEVGPDPIRAVGPGRFELEAFGGIGLTADGSVAVAESNGRLALLNPADRDLSLAFLSSPVTLAGDPIMSIDELSALFEAQVYELQERSSSIVGDVTIRAFDIAAGEFPEPILLLDPSEVGLSGAGWPPGGAWWVIEDPELGLFIVEGVHEVFGVPPTEDMAYVDELLETLEFRSGQ